MIFDDKNNCNRSESTSDARLVNEREHDNNCEEQWPAINFHETIIALNMFCI